MADMKGGEFLGGLVVGALMGAALGIIFAPAKGEETRAVIKEKGTEIKEKVSKRAEELVTSGREKLKEGAKEFVTSGREKLKEGAEQVVAAVRRGKAEAEKS